jgi:ferrous iron transport protein A
MATRLADVDAGGRFRIEDVPDTGLRARLIRLGFLDGPVRCSHRVRNGPVIIARDGTELALGASVAGNIEIAEVEGE